MTQNKELSIKHEMLKTQLLHYELNRKHFNKMAITDDFAIDLLHEHEKVVSILSALQSEQAGVNEELVNILNAILQHNEENELFDRCCNDGDGRFDTFQSEELVTLLDTAKQAVAAADKLEQEQK